MKNFLFTSKTHWRRCFFTKKYIKVNRKLVPIQTHSTPHTYLFYFPSLFVKHKVELFQHVLLRSFHLPSLCNMREIFIHTYLYATLVAIAIKCLILAVWAIRKFEVFTFCIILKIFFLCEWFINHLLQPFPEWKNMWRRNSFIHIQWV